MSGPRRRRSRGLGEPTRHPDKGIDARRARHAALGTIVYPELPVTDRRAELLDAIRDNQVLVVAGETGSGKSTQLPKLCLELGRGINGLIGHTQPRRLAARSVAERVAEELGTEVGDAVGYSVRFNDQVQAHTLVKVMTDGILLAEIQRDRDLRRYDTIIIDEAHERSLNIDFLLGYLTQLLPRRPDLKVIITSATIDTDRFAAHFDAPAIEVTGRTHPVEIRYRPFGGDDPDDPADRRDQNDAICDAVAELWAEDAHDVLVFLSGEREIHDAADAIKGMKLADTEVLPLYARLSASEQHRIFASHKGRRVVLATNVAETSLTVPGIRSVIDVGTARISRYSRRLKVQRLPIEGVSRASADQRAGRCGRVAPGTCIRLYTQEDFDERDEFTEPEILRTNLASVILQMASLRLGEVADFPFVEPPDARAVTDGVKLLEELGAFDPSATEAGDRLTDVGRRLSRLPIDPRLGRMIIEAERHGCVREVLIITAAMSIQDPRERPSDKQEQASQAHARFNDSGSDFLAFLEVWEYIRQQQQALSGNAFRRRCRTEFLHFLRIREWQDLVRQLRSVCKDIGVSVTSDPADADGIHRSLLSGLLGQIGMREGDKQEYRGARNAAFLIGRQSALKGAKPPWVMMGELVETNRLWGRVGARIRPEWAEELGSHLCRYQYELPEWDGDRGQAACIERATLYGLPVIAGRRINYGRVDPEHARELFIRHALVEGDWETHHPFLEENRTVVDDLQALADRARRGDVIAPDHELFEFYDARVGDDVTSGGDFNRWWKQARRDKPDLLTLRADDLVDADDAVGDPVKFPDEWVVESADPPLRLTLSYEFDPTSPTDGVTVTVPVDVLNQVPDGAFDWQVPGLRRQAVDAMLRSLPKRVRRALVPMSEHVDALLDGRETGSVDEPLFDVVAAHISSSTPEHIERSDVQADRIDRALRMTIVVVDPEGEVVAAGKDLTRLQTRTAQRVEAAITDFLTSVGDGRFGQTGLLSWPTAADGTVIDLSEIEEVERDGRTVVGYPALVDEERSVGVRLCRDKDEQWTAMWLGTRRLLVLASHDDPRRAVIRRLSKAAQMAMAANRRGRLADVIDDCLSCAAESILADAGGPSWTAVGYESLRLRASKSLVDIAVEVAEALARALAAVGVVEATMAGLVTPTVRDSVADVSAHLDRLLAPGCATAAGRSRVGSLARYVEADAHRLAKIGRNVARDLERTKTIAGLERAFTVAEAKLPAHRLPDAVDVRWMLEELRVQLFAESLGTSGTVSAKRVRSAIDELGT